MKNEQNRMIRLVGVEQALLLKLLDGTSSVIFENLISGALANTRKLGVALAKALGIGSRNLIVQPK